MTEESWQTAAARSFCRALPSPAVAGAQSTRAYRDIKGWIAGLVHAVHAVRWAALAASVEHACRSSFTLRCEEATCAVTRAIIELVVVRQPDESRRIVTSNARRQCARKDGRLSLIRLVDLALALANIRRVLSSPSYNQNDYAVATHFWHLVSCFKGLRAVHEMDDTARSIDLYLFDSSWADEHSSPDVFALDYSVLSPPPPPSISSISSISSNSSSLSTTTTTTTTTNQAVSIPGTVDNDVIARTKKIIRFAVARASRNPSGIDFAPSSNLFRNGFNIMTAAFTADFDPERALSIADHCVKLTPEVVTNVRHGLGPLPLKDLRQTLFCQQVMQEVPHESQATIVQKLAQLFVPVGWHRGGTKTEDGHIWLGECAQVGNFSAQAVLGRQMAESGNMQGKTYLRSAEQKGDVAAPIILGDLYRDGNSFIAPNVTLAKKYYLTAIKRGSALAALNLGTMYLAQHFPGNSGELRKTAAELFQTSVDRGNARAALALGNLLFEKGPQGNGSSHPDFDRAERCYSIAVHKTTIAAVRLHAKYGLAMVALEKSEIVKGVEALEEILVDAESDKTRGEIELQHELDGFRRRVYNELAEIYSKFSSRGQPMLINQRCLSAAELREKACMFYMNVTKLDEANSEAWYKLAMLRLQGRKDYTGAENALRNAIWTGHTRAAYTLGNILLEQHRLKEGLEALEEGAGKYRDGRAAARAAMVCLEYMKDKEGAKKFLQLAETLELEHETAKSVADIRRRIEAGTESEQDVPTSSIANGKRKRANTNMAFRPRCKRRTAMLHAIGPLPMVSRHGWGGMDLHRWASECISARYWHTWIDLSERNCGKKCIKKMIAQVLDISQTTKTERRALKRAFRTLIDAAKKVTKAANQSIIGKLYKWGTPKERSGEAVLKCTLFNTPHPAVRIERRIGIAYQYGRMLAKRKKPNRIEDKDGIARGKNKGDEGGDEMDWE